MLAPYAGEATWRGACKALSTCATRTRPSSCLALTSSRQQTPISLHQRKFSSSKASNASKSETRPINTDATKAAATPDSKPTLALQSPDNELVTQPRSRKRKPKDGSLGEKQRQAEQVYLPSVPSTQRLHPLDVHLASFFSQHRPISITHNIPPAVTQEAFTALFSSSLKLDPAKRKTDDVIQTLSAAVTHLDDTLAHQEAASNMGTASEEAEMRAQLSEITSTNETEILNINSAGAAAQFDANDLIKRLRPFMPPPPPVPQASGLSKPEETSYQQDPVHTTYTSTVTLYETLHPSGHRTYKTVATPIVSSSSDPSSSSAYNLPTSSSPASSSSEIKTPPQHIPYLERVRDYRRSVAGIMQLISVKRQRKLKMKKHKHRKLLKRTRNLRRKLDKT